MSPIHPTSRVRASLRQVSAELEGETVVLNFDDGTYYSLDPVAARIWALIQRPNRVEAVQETLLEEFEVEPERCLTDLLRLLDELEALKLVEVEEGSDP
ncbi:MAG: PqqD family protein [Planctomycetota bacterium]